MRRRSLLGVALGLAALLPGAAPIAAHEGEEEAAIRVEPSTVAAGTSCVLAGSGLEPNSERVLVLAGEDLIVEFGTVTTDEEGMFRAELAIPDHLPAGTYELRAIGDETLTTPLALTAASPASEQPPAADPGAEAIMPRERAPLELALILVFVVTAMAVGGLLVWRAERFRGATSA